MSDEGQQSPGQPDEGAMPTEEELRQAYEQQLKALRVDDVLIQTIVTLINLGGRRAGLAPGTEDERDLDQVRLAVEGVRALLPLIEAQLGPDAATIRDALSQLQLAYAQTDAAPAGDDGSPAEPEGSGPAQSSGRLWVPGQ
jgi:hypothetical protein